jgi:gliding motility-associated-like protein
MKKIFLLLLLIPNIVIGQCSGNLSYTLSIPPGPNNTYPPGSVVELCVTMDGWNGNDQGSNWFEGFYLALGWGWQTVTPTLYPEDAEEASGAWIWATSTASPNGATAGNGFYFEGPSGPTDGNPGNDWGDSCPSTTCVWSCCVELIAQNGNPGADLHIGVIPYSDGTMGSWNIQTCNEVQTIFFEGSIGCFVPGCTDPLACNFDPNADCEDGACILPGCTDPIACNFNPNTTCDDGSCIFPGCTDLIACNFDPQAGCDDGSCGYFSMGQITHNLIPGPDTTCVGSQIHYAVTGNPSSTYEWNLTGGGIIQTDQNLDISVIWGEDPDLYTVAVQEITQEGCIGEVETCEVLVIQPDIVFNSPNNLCYNQSLILSATPEGGEWIGENVNGQTFIGYQTGITPVTYSTTIHGCQYEEILPIFVKPHFKGPEIVHDKLVLDLCLDPKDQIYTAIDERSSFYVWSLDSTLININDNTFNISWYDTTNTYVLRVHGVDQSGCLSETSSISIRTEACQTLFVPNSFTPNGDDLNDIFKIYGTSIYNPVLKIYDKWGNEIYRSPNLYWNGDNGIGYYCNTDIYAWEVEYRDKEGLRKLRKGFVALIR